MVRPVFMQDSSQMTDYSGLKFDVANFRWHVSVDVLGTEYQYGSWRMDDAAARAHDLIMYMLRRDPVNNSMADLTSPEVRKLVDDVRERLGGTCELKEFLKLSEFDPSLVRQISEEGYRRRVTQLKTPTAIANYIAANGDVEMYFQPRISAWCGIAITSRLSSLCVYTSQPFGHEWGGR